MTKEIRIQEIQRVSIFRAPLGFEFRYPFDIRHSGFVIIRNALAGQKKRHTRSDGHFPGCSTVQPWSPFQYGFFQGVFLDNERFPELNQKIDEIAAAKGVTNTAIAIAWILRHPAHMQPIVGTTNPGRLKDICKASDITLTRQEWYEIYLAAGNKLP